NVPGTVGQTDYAKEMPQAIFIHNTNLYLHPLSLDLMDVSDRDDLSACLHGPYPWDRFVDSFATAGPFGRLDFWFSRWPGPEPRAVNRPATELFMYAANLRPRTVPLLRGRVIVISHDPDGALSGLTNEQISAIAVHANSWRTPLRLDWRYAVDAHAQRRQAKILQRDHRTLVF
ncbi:MAG: hypothetical protein VYB90_07870, partial [Actinomycetota bacterium]|nr:hypothetical protein [Actinomycetota bacterium]